MSVSIDIILDELMSHYDVFRISDLADKMGVSQQTVSAWKSRNSINAIIKKCRELGIFNEILIYKASNRFALVKLPKMFKEVKILPMKMFVKTLI